MLRAFANVRQQHTKSKNVQLCVVFLCQAALNFCLIFRCFDTRECTLNPYAEKKEAMLNRMRKKNSVINLSNADVDEEGYEPSEDPLFPGSA